MKRINSFYIYFRAADTFKYIIGKFDYKIMSIIIFPDINLKYKI